MHDPGPPWTPHLGDYVLVNETGEGGVVMDVTGSGSDRRVVVAVLHPPLRDHPPTPPTPPCRTYRPEDLTPAPRP